MKYSFNVTYETDDKRYFVSKVIKVSDNTTAGYFKSPYMKTKEFRYVFDTITAANRQRRFEVLAAQFANMDNGQRCEILQRDLAAIQAAGVTTTHACRLAQTNICTLNNYRAGACLVNPRILAKIHLLAFEAQKFLAAAENVLDLEARRDNITQKGK